MRMSYWSSDVCTSDLLVDELTRALIETPPVDAAQGGYIAEGHDAALDALRETARDGRKAIAALEADYRARTGIAALKIRHNGVLVYHVEVPAKHADALMAPESGFTPRQTHAGEIGRASCRERGCQYVSYPGVP